MKHKKIFICAALATTITTHASSEPICDVGSCTDATWSYIVNTFVGCHGSTCECTLLGSGTTTYNCGCESDYDCLDFAYVSDGTYTSGYCADNVCHACKECSDCNTIDWADSAPGYQLRIEKYCDCDGTCYSTNQYRCKAGYYGRSTNGTSGCTPCPSLGDISGTSAIDSRYITSCYIPKGSYPFSDSTGSGTITYESNCYYTN